MAKTVLITGASSGFGKVIAQKFLDEGWNVAATMRKPDATLYPQSDRLKLIQLDVTDQSSVERAIASALEAFGAIDVLVNNAGIGVMSAVEFTPDSIVRDVFETNLFGMMRMCRAIAAQMRAQGGGTILNMSSSMALTPMPFMSIYSATKWAIEGFSEALAYELAPFDIAVRVLQPGLAPTTRFGDNSVTGTQSLTPEPYGKIAQSYFSRLQENYPAAFTTEEEVAEDTFAAANQLNPQLRFQIGADTKFWHAKRRALEEGAFLDSIRATFVQAS